MENISDIRLITNMATELGISPSDIFAHWLKNGEITDISICIAYKNGDIIKSSLLQPQVSSEDELPKFPPTVAQDAVDETPKHLSEQEKNSEKQPNTDIRPAAFSCKGTLRLKEAQKKCMQTGSFVYTTGDILPKHGALKNVKVRGIVFLHSEDRITILKYAGNGFSALAACAQTTDGWRFLTYQECLLLVKNKEKLNAGLSELKRKQINGSLLIWFQDQDKEISAFDIASGKVVKTQNKDAIEDRHFSLYLVKDLKIV